MGSRLSSSVWSGMAFLLAVCGLIPAAEARDLRIASEGARPPFNLIDKRGDLAGFEIDLAREICKRIEARCTFVQQEWESMLTGLKAGQFDLVMSAMEITPEREEEALFSEPYVRMPYAFVAARQREIHDASPAAMRGRLIGVVEGGEAHRYIEDKYRDAQVRLYASLEDAILDLAADRIEAVFGPKDALWRFMTRRREAQCCKFLSDVPHDPDYFGPGMAAAMRKDETALKAQIDKALTDMTDDGTFADIRSRYIPYRIRE